jgi:hypothetical protein
LDRVEPYTECRMFAIYYCTVVEMSPDDCQYILGEKKKILLDRFELWNSIRINPMLIYWKVPDRR